MKFFYLFFIYILFLVNFSCTSNNNEDTSLHNTNFKLANFFSNQIDSLQKNESFVNLKTTLNNDVFDTILQEVNWQKELQLFSDLELENQKYKDSFICDTIFSKKNVMLIKYSAIEKNNKIKLVEIFIANQQVKTVFAKLNTNNYLYKTTTTLYYDANGYFSISAKDNFRWLGFLNTDLEVKGTIN